MNESQAVLRKLNQHPLNQAAAVQLRKLAPGWTPAPKVTPVLELAMQALEETDSRLEAVAEISRSPQAQERAVRKLAEYLTPDELTAGTPEETGAQIADELQPSNPQE